VEVSVLKCSPVLQRKCVEGNWIWRATHCCCRSSTLLLQCAEGCCVRSVLAGCYSV